MTGTLVVLVLLLIVRLLVMLLHNERTPTEGLIYATTRHATSRAGDPCPHDHVLVANVVRMADEASG